MSEFGVNYEKMSGNVKRSLIDKSILLETARNLLNQELNHFTEKTADEIKVFLTSPCTGHTQDGENLLKIVDSKLHVIQKLFNVFTSLKSDPHSLNLHLFGRSPHRVFLLHDFISNQARLFIPQVLKFGPLLQTSIQTSSISRAMQIFGSTPSVYLTSSIQSEQEPPCKLECDCTTETKVRKDKELKVNAAESEIDMNTKDHFLHHQTYPEVVQNVASPEVQNVASPEVVQNVASPEVVQNVASPEVVQNVASPEVVQNVASPVFTQQFEGIHEVQHQKQTSSQLICFLKRNRNIDVCKVSLSSTIEESSVLMQQVKSKSVPALDQKSKSDHRSPEKQPISEMDVSGPVFKVKSFTDCSLTFSCMIATHSELWDIGNVSTDTLNCQQDRLVDFTDLGGVPEPLGPSCCSNSESFNSEPIENMCELSAGSVDGQKVEVPEFQIKKFEEMSVVVTHVISPSQFYIQHKDTSLQELSDIMAKTHRKSYAERNCIPDIGVYVMGLFSEPERWCRAQVMKICGINNGSHGVCRRDLGIMNIEVEIRRIDYGDTARISLWNVKDLCAEAAEAPAQALLVSLAEVNPVNGESWSDEAIGWFKDKVKNRTLYARLYPQTNTMKVALFMEKGKIGAMRRGASLSVRLAQNGHAKHNRMKNLQLKRSSAQERSRKQSLEWEKYLLSCYSHHQK